LTRRFERLQLAAVRPVENLPATLLELISEAIRGLEVALRAAGRALGDESLSLLSIRG
jgi:hypothetical protein